MSDPLRAARGERLRPWFALQVRFAEAVAAATECPIEAAVARFTNAHRRFGLGRIAAGVTAPGWKPFADRLATCTSFEERLDCIVRFFVEAAPERPAPYALRSGCFGLEAPTEDGTVRIHFTVPDRSGSIGPLRREHRDERVAELERLFAALRETHPEARSVRGGSWLYHLDAYRRLFPPAYVESIRPLEANPRFDGTSSWGQFLDHRERVKEDLAEAFLRNLARLDPVRLWMAFPLPALSARADLSAFYAHYGIRMPS